MAERHIFWWAAVIFVALCCSRLFADVTHTLDVDGRQRAYTVHQPANATGALPVVMVFHGGGSNAKVMARYTGMNSKADQAGFLVVYPSGTGRIKHILTWNGGGCCGYAVRQKVDDVKFARAMLDDLARRYNIDARRVYATGLSNGAMMSYKLAAEMADRITAIAPIGAAMALDDPKPSRPVPVIHFHGKDDAFAVYGGGRGRQTVSRHTHMPVDDCIAKWVKINRCTKEAKVEQLADKDPADGCTVRRESYTPTTGGAPVVLYVIEGGGHTWPGRDQGRVAGRRLKLGPSTHDIDANDEMWRFFQRFALPAKPVNGQ